ncbi:MAG: cation-translocating P-type ATPase [Bacteroidota bacterium]
MPISYFNIKGLTQEQVLESRKKNGSNALHYKKQNTFLNAIKSIVKEPMVVLLLAAASIYFISGQIGDGIFLASTIIMVTAISLFQDSRSRNALEKLKEFTKPSCKVIRNGETVEIKSEDIVIGDSLIVEEGTSIVADGTIIHANDFAVDESIITGESLPVEKDTHQENSFIFNGTTAVRGLAIANVTAIGNETKLGKIGKSLESITEEKTPLEIQINNFVKKLAFVGVLVFLIVWAINYFQSYQLLDSLLKALTLAISILPEEIPVAFTSFMALGAWRLMKMGIVVKQMKTIETLGSATVICTDKTGTITENKMSLAKVYALTQQKIVSADEVKYEAEKSLIRIAMWASEPIPFDPMEKSLHEAYSQTMDQDERHQYKIVHEYALNGKPPMMTHVFEDKEGNRIIAAKGAPEALIAVSDLSTNEKQQIEQTIKTLAYEGYRILGVGEGTFTGNNFPDKQEAISFSFKGVIAFYDPPKKDIDKVIAGFYKAGINVKIITGDNTETTTSIAKQIGIIGYEKNITGDDLMLLTDEDLQKKVLETNLFTRMFPEAKLKIINALKSQNQIVAMTGDGVNDGPALKAAHIGIAMGKKGTEIAKQAASLILLEDDLSKMLDAVAMGRKIYTNLKKGIQYIISIHIPIILTVFIPLALGWIYPNIFSPLHIIFLELIMGPTCSIIYENEPIETNTMLQKPRPFSSTFFSWKEITISIIQGIMITAGTLFIYQYAIQQNMSESHTRTMVFLVLITANIFLTLINRSFYYSIFTTIRYRNNMVLLIIFITIAITAAMIYINPLAGFFKFSFLNLFQIFICITTGFLSVIWFEVVKLIKRLP